MTVHRFELPANSNRWHTDRDDTTTLRRWEIHMRLPLSIFNTLLTWQAGYIYLRGLDPKTPLWAYRCLERGCGHWFGPFEDQRRDPIDEKHHPEAGTRSQKVQKWVCERCKAVLIFESNILITHVAHLDEARHDPPPLFTVERP